jgi:hypothetical protein
MNNAALATATARLREAAKTVEVQPVDWSDLIVGAVRRVLDAEVEAAWDRGEDGDEAYDQLVCWISDEVEAGTLELG